MRVYDTSMFNFLYFFRVFSTKPHGKYSILRQLHVKTRVYDTFPTKLKPPFPRVKSIPFFVKAEIIRQVQTCKTFILE